MIVLVYVCMYVVVKAWSRMYYWQVSGVEQKQVQTNLVIHKWTMFCCNSFVHA